jgi:hypothetical protein
MLPYNLIDSLPVLFFTRYEVRRATLIDLVGCTCDLINSLLYLHAFLLFYRGYSTRLPENLAVDVIPLMETDNASSDSLSLLDPGLSGLSVV